MMQSNLIRWAIPLAAIAFLSFVQLEINGKRTNRGRQFAMPIIAAVYAVAGIIFLYVRGGMIDLILDLLAVFLPIFSGLTVVVGNVALMAAFLLFKCVACPICHSKWKDFKLMEETSITFYEYDEVYSTWFLRKSWSNVRMIFQIFSQIGTVLTGMLLAITWAKGEEALTWQFWFPCAALIVINEIYSYLNGQTKEEFMHTVLGDESDARGVANYYRMREIYEKIFPQSILNAHTGAEYSAKQGATDLLNKMETSEEELDQIVARFYQTYDEKMEFDIDCIQASAKLLERKSVVFLNPFYRDVTPYLTLPLLQSLLKGKNCLVVAGRSSTAKDAVLWLEDTLKDYSHLRSMWRVKQLTRNEPDCEVGVLDFQHLYAVEVLNANKEFLREVDFVLLLEPSAMVSTGQIGLTILSEEAGRNGEVPVYCICDRYTDAIVDTMSHLLHTELTDVVAAPVPHCIYTGMLWDADGDYMRQSLFDKQTKFLGNGMELAATAIKNQVPKVAWHGETKAPLRDIKWIAGQQCATICRYMNLPAQQKNLYEKVEFSPNLWCAKATKEQFIIVEDEFCNMFNLLRAFLSRGEKQIFVNVLSENYLLRDYMRCNQQMFLTNPNAVPSLTPAYAKTERNSVFKLLILMAIRPVSEIDVTKELQLLGYPCEDAFATFSMLLKRYTPVDGAVLSVKSVTENTMAIGAYSTNFFYITPEVFNEHFAASLKNAYYVVEEETRDLEFIDAKLFGHITQTILPGQFVVYDGKYYQAKFISPENGVVLRRASDLYNGRRYYRQVRTYHFAGIPEEALQYHRKTLGMEIAISSCDFSVSTTGYLDMNDNHDLRMAKTVDFSGDPTVHLYDRSYKNKNILQLTLPDTDDKLRFTLCMLLEEMFHSIFPNAWQYLVATTKQPSNIDGMLTHMVYGLDGEVDDNVIYILEDSDIDLGLLDAVARSLPQMFEIIADFLDWHFEQMREPEPEPEEPVAPKPKVAAPEKPQGGLFARLAKRIRKLLGKQDEPSSVATPEQTVDSTDAPEETSTVAANAPDEVASTAAPEAALAPEETTATNTNPADAPEEMQSEALPVVEPAESAQPAADANDVADATEVTEVTEAEPVITTEQDIAESAPVLAANAEEQSSTLPELVAETAEATADATATSQDTPPVKAVAIPENAETTLTAVQCQDDKHEDESAPEIQETQADAVENLAQPSKATPSDESVSEAAPSEAAPSDDEIDLAHRDGTDIFENEEIPEEDLCQKDEQDNVAIGPTQKTKYQQECYLNFGFDKIDSRLKFEDVFSYLHVRGFCDNTLTRARKSTMLKHDFLDCEATNQCDFCGVPLTGISYDRLNDGRVRCNDCSSSAITTVDEFKTLFYQILEMQAMFFGISIHVPINLKTTDARTIAKGAGSVFRPSTGFAPRVLGYAQRTPTEYNLLIENGSPRLATIDTMVHELTHIWQYLNWNDRDIAAAYHMHKRGCTARARDIVYEGMAMWTSIQYLYLIGESYYAAQQDALARSRDDVYGIGYRLFAEQYPLVKDMSLVKYSPFQVFPPLEPEDVIAACKATCTEKVCRC